MEKKFFIICLIFLIYVFSGIFFEREYKEKVIFIENRVSLSPTPDPKKIGKINALEKFFEKYNSSLKSYSKDFINISENHNLDWRLLPAIAGVESTFGKFTPSCAKFNPFGWTSSTSPCGFWRFKDFGEAIEVVGGEIGGGATYKRFQKEKRVETLASIYNPLDNTKRWIDGVNFFMLELEKIWKEMN